MMSFVYARKGLSLFQVVLLTVSALGLLCSCGGANDQTGVNHPDDGSCDPPYVTDGNGIKKYKPECL